MIALNCFVRSSILTKFSANFSWCQLRLAWKSAEGTTKLCWLKIVQNTVLRTNALYKKTDLCPKILCDKKYLALEMPICIFSLLVIWSNFDNLYPLRSPTVHDISKKNSHFIWLHDGLGTVSLSLSILWA